MHLNFFRRKHGCAQPEGAQPSVATLQPVSELSLGADVSTLDGTGFVHYQWLLDHTKAIVGYHVRWIPRAEHVCESQGLHLQSMVSTLAQGLLDRSGEWRLGKTGLLLDIPPDIASAMDWCGLPPKHVVLRWTAQHFAAPESLPVAQALRTMGFGLMLSGEVPQAKEARDQITHFDVGAGDALAMSTLRSIGKRPVHPIATVMDGWAGFDSCASRRVPVLVSPDIEPPKRPAQKGALQPEALLIIRVLQMVQRNEDIREIEASLKHDAALTYRFLKRISSPAVSAGVEIESLRHAVSILGYQRLFRWLTTMLATTEAKSSPPFLMKKAIVRGRFVELLGHPALLTTTDADNLFLVGMFSAIDQLLGVSLEQLVEHVQLPENVSRALLQCGGMYGPFLRLALAFEAGAPETDTVVDELLMSASQVNAAHLAAIAWGQEIVRAEY